MRFNTTLHEGAAPAVNLASPSDCLWLDPELGLGTVPSNNRTEPDDQNTYTMRLTNSSTTSRAIAALWLMLLWLPSSITLAQKAHSVAAASKHEAQAKHQGHQHDDLTHLLNMHEQQIHFTENKGQFGPGVLFRADFPFGQAVATPQGMVVTAFDPVEVEKRIADGFATPHDAALWEPYRAECRALGKPDPGPMQPLGPVFLWVAEDVEAAWRILMPHVLGQIEEYVQFTVEGYGEARGPYRGGVSPAQARANPAYRVLTPEEAIALGQRLGPRGLLLLNPLMGGIPVHEAWRMLRLFETRVLPHLP